MLQWENQVRQNFKKQNPLNNIILDLIVAKKGLTVSSAAFF